MSIIIRIRMINNSIFFLSCKGADGAVTVPCTGDEGSPLVVVGDGDEPVVVGLFSYNDECNAAVPSVFTRVSVYYAWIGKTAGAQPNNCFVNPAPIIITAKDNYAF